ncbi:MAG: ASCH domain-containing protein [Clostridia bacterium]|nr:ASCH domain-containing protein [Clostridia bacterium]MBQ7792971.1 ASCH domain-containing protein [Clostridia bacterium]
MSKSVLISIQPKWCELIASGEKTVEVRKTKPKLETPFKCYIYETKKKINPWCNGKGKVIGEFVCSNIAKGTSQFGSCLTMQEISEYANNKEVYGWCISDLKIYDKPRELSEFYKPCVYGEDSDVSCFLCVKSGYRPDMHIDCFNKVARPPVSWCYVDEV